MRLFRSICGGAADRIRTVITLDRENSESVRILDRENSESVRTLDRENSENVRILGRENSESVRILDRENYWQETLLRVKTKFRSHIDFLGNSKRFSEESSKEKFKSKPELRKKKDSQNFLGKKYRT